MLARRNLQPTRAKRWMTVRGQQELQALALSPVPATIREDCVALLRVLDTQVRRLDIELQSRWGDDPRVHRLLTIPGIGPFIAIVLVLELGDIHRFPTAKHLASYIGLTPRVRASADRVRSGHISKEGASSARCSSPPPPLAQARPLPRLTRASPAPTRQEDFHVAWPGAWPSTSTTSAKRGLRSSSYYVTVSSRVG